MSQAEYIKDIAKFGLENNQEKLLNSLNDFIEHSKKTRKVNFALQLQSLLKESIRNQQVSGLTAVGSRKFAVKELNKDIDNLILLLNEFSKI